MASLLSGESSWLKPLLQEREDPDARRPHQAGALLEVAHRPLPAARRHAGVVRLPARAPRRRGAELPARARSEENTSELKSLMRISYAVICWTHINTPSPHTNLLCTPNLSTKTT